MIPKLEANSGPIVGGMGLTGIIYEATFRIIEIETSLVSVDTYRFEDLDSLMQT